MPAEHCVLVTRPEGQAQALLAAIAAQGMRALHLPMLRLEPLEPLPPAVRQCIIDLDRYDHLVFISVNAARIGLSLIDDYWPQYPAGQQCWAVGASTARALERAGLAVCAPREDMTSEGLLAMPGLGDLSGQRVLIVKGEGGRRTLEDQFAARGARVDTLPCYRRLGPSLTASECRAALREAAVDLILASSGEGLGHLSRLLQPQENTTLADIALVVPSERVATEARQQGWRRPIVAANASDQAMLAAVAQWRCTSGGENRH
jgi:uroporphyrinogen-III synthase